MTPLVTPDNFVHEDDNLVLEDESGRVNLKGSVLSPSVYVTGNVVALHGKETSAGDFLVEDVLEAGLPPQMDLPNKSGYCFICDTFLFFIIACCNIFVFNRRR